MALPLDLDALQGKWSLTRVMLDRRNNCFGRFRGILHLRSESDGSYNYEESGVLRYGATEMPATQAYIWRHEGGGIHVYFTDGRYFHRIAACTLPAASHFCSPDQYQVMYDFSGFPRSWKADWQVRGPRKDYLLRSRMSLL